MIGWFPRSAEHCHGEALIAAHLAFRGFPRPLKFDPEILRAQLQTELAAMEAMQPDGWWMEEEITARRRGLTVMIGHLGRFRKAGSELDEG
jgi:hypothetical protein